MTIAPLDRLITTGNNADARKDARPLSSLLNEPFIVLLGAPGMGKSVALSQLAQLDGKTSHPAFSLIDQTFPPGSTVYIDALDEISIEEARAIARALQRTPDVRWRITCRAESWNEGGRLSQSFGGMGAARETFPIVAQLLPLLEQEAIQVLQAFGCVNPVAFLTRLEVIRSTVFTMTPLGLKFLMGVNVERLALLTRFELYQSGVEHLAFEHNNAKQEDFKRTALTMETRLDIAGRVSLALLLSGKHRVKPNALVDDSALTKDDLRLDYAVLAFVLDTALFIKNGDVFQPLHRSIQEFLAGRYLARLVTDGLGSSKLHAERVLALIVSSDGFSSDGLRPLYAWYTGHLVSQGALQEARRLVERDPETLLLHGDTAKLPVDARLTVLKEVGARDPFFRWAPQQWSPAEITTVGLITPDIVDQVIAMLDVETSGYRINMLLEALSVGQPYVAAADACWSMVMSQAAVEWCRRQAVIAWLHCASPSIEEIWARIECLHGLAQLEVGNLRSMAQLFCAIPGSQLMVADVDRILVKLKSAHAQLNQWPRISTYSSSSSSSISYAIRDVAWHAAENLWPTLITDDPKRWRFKAGKGSTEQIFASSLGIAVIAQFETTLREFACLLFATGVITGEDSSFTRTALELIEERGESDDLISEIVELTDQEVADCGAIAMGLRALGLTATESSVSLLLNSSQLLARTGTDYVVRQVVTWVLTQGERAPDWFLSLLSADLDPDLVSMLTARLHMHEQEVSLLEKQASESLESELLRYIAECQSAQVLTNEQLQGLLSWGAEIYCGNPPISGVKGFGLEALSEAFGETLARVVANGLVDRVYADGKDTLGGAIGAASASLLLDRGQDLVGFTISQVFAIFLSTQSLRCSYLKERLEDRCVCILEKAIDTELDFFVQLSLTKGASWSLLLRKLGEKPSAGEWQAWAVRTVFQQPDLLQGGTLAAVLRLARVNLGEEELTIVVRSYIDSLGEQSTRQSHAGLPSTFIADRLQWAYFGVCIQPATFSVDFTRALDTADDYTIHRLIVDDYPNRGFYTESSTVVTVSTFLIELFMYRSPAIDGHYDRMWVDTAKVLKSIRLSNDPRTESVLKSLVVAAEDTAWEYLLKHELEVYRRDSRSQANSAVTPTDLAKVIESKGPINVLDLRALTLMVLQDLAMEIQSSSLNTWKRYWNPAGPKMENDCRDILADKLRDRLRVYGDFEVYPEAASSGGTRADMLVTYGTLTLPMEAKRTSHDHLWYGHSGQLQTYALAPSTQGEGIYVVFWFGSALKIYPSPEGMTPETPGALKAALEAQLSVELAAKTSVVVLDLSDAAAGARARKEHGLKQQQTAKRQKRESTRANK